MLRDKLCDAVIDFKKDNKLTYEDLMNLSGLNRTQLYNIMNNNGEEVRLEKIESAIYNFGKNIKIEVI